MEKNQKEIEKELEELRKREKELEEKIQKLETIAKNSNLRVAELQREIDYLKERYRRDLEEQRKFCYEKFAYDLLEVMDNFERALEYGRQAQDVKSILLGIEMIYSEMKKIFEKYGIREIPVEGKEFDPYVAEAVEKVETDQYPPNTVVKVIRKGYYIHDKVLRPARVAVAVPPQEEEGEEIT
ncbi:nucleotide exchange factor GrpE [Aquifex aeolicus]|uniref:Protein GrpE n=1 Tax=Aquifex aeolicus (strain VF5) TaxID=224324 RepID=GRPE_AQUAE|nr:nucleotide exchange factor GrpE [Aquifex aeolicus]O66745.1 RecName: Full=Protein GrpE; AltName: Full=HSP-70 cofactor [Aquifex aeolicus VF5]AAC06707.1 heat shock protein GrpE [Aquifex aeolicus VF5]